MKESKNKEKSVFIHSSISPQFVGESIAKHQTKTSIGAHEIFLGQVRSDIIENKAVMAIEFSAYEEMANEKAAEIREEAFEKFNITCMHVYHSLGRIEIGEICFFVFASSAHRADARHAVAWLVDKIKSELPIFGKEILEDNTEIWKTNKPLK